MKVFTVWQSGEGDEHTLAPGKAPPVFGDGSTQSGCNRQLFQIEAATWEEAMAIYHLRMGWKPYAPGGQSKCESCGAVVFGSGSCWRCDGK
jgi:hypothetical protein